MHAHAVAEKHHLIGPVMEQPQYNLFHRYKVEEEFSHLYDTYGLGLTIWSPLASGLLTGKYNRKIPKDSRLAIEGLEWLKEKVLRQELLKKVELLAALASELGISLPVLSIAWCIKNPHVSTVILGASKVKQLKENLTALDALPLLNEEVMESMEMIIESKGKDLI
jgi:aryl-alcohol dehydrogenase-like predicted oxidoreductase